jgi:hypothetical protein
MALPMVGQKALQKVAGKADELAAQKAGQMVAGWVHQMDTSMGHKKVQPMAVQLAGRWVGTWEVLMALPMVGQKARQKVAGKADELVAEKADELVAQKAGQMVAEWVHQMDTSMGHKKVQPMAVQLAGWWVETWDLLMALPMVGQKALQKVAGKADELVAQKVDLRVDWMAWWKVVSKADV